MTDASAPELDLAANLRLALAGIPSLYTQLPLALTTNTTGTPRAQRGSHTAGSKPPVGLHILFLMDERNRNGSETDAAGIHQLDRMAGDRRQGVVPELFMWARLVEAEMLDQAQNLPPDMPDVPTARNMCAWLEQTTDWAASQPWFRELHDDIVGMWWQLRQLLGEANGTPAVRHLERAGGCGGRIERLGNVWRCTGTDCGQEWTLQEVTLPEAAARLDVQVRTLRKWADRGLLVKTGETQVGGRAVAVYDLDTIRNHIAQSKIGA